MLNTLIIILVSIMVACGVIIFEDGKSTHKYVPKIFAGAAVGLIAVILLQVILEHFLLIPFLGVAAYLMYYKPEYKFW
jgi:hypothetical protein